MARPAHAVVHTSGACPLIVRFRRTRTKAGQEQPQHHASCLRIQFVAQPGPFPLLFKSGRNRLTEMCVCVCVFLSRPTCIETVCFCLALVLISPRVGGWQSLGTGNLHKRVIWASSGQFLFSGPTSDLANEKRVEAAQLKGTLLIHLWREGCHEMGS